ncbi:MAG TPA: DUF4833 domain-containing protein [Minicystis sp.]|nr:DUF4833 domain-containing protein [Minicystis sp.]
MIEPIKPRSVALLLAPLPSRAVRRKIAQMVASLRNALAAVAALVAIASAASPAAADEIRFGANDVPTVFFINKSDDHNRVDYGIHLDASCAPVNDDAVFPYWREFEKAPPVRTHPISFIERVPYGFSQQKTLKRTPEGGEQLVVLKQFDRAIVVATKRDGARCSAVARSTIKGQVAQLLSVFAKLAGPISVDYIDVHGKDFATGAALLERIKK